MATAPTNNAVNVSTTASSLSEEAPVRIIVQTKTPLVPGGDYFERITFVQNLICQQHWNRDFFSMDANLAIAGMFMVASFLTIIATASFYSITARQRMMMQCRYFVTTGRENTCMQPLVYTM